MWYQPIIAELLNVLVSIVIALLGLVLAYVTYYIRKVSQRLQEKSKNELIDNAISRLEQLVTVSVQAAEQTVAAELRQAVKDGKVDRSELLALADNVKQQVLAKLNTETLAILKETFGDVDRLVTDYIEAKVLELKQSTAIVEVQQLVNPTS